MLVIREMSHDMECCHLDTVSSVININCTSNKDNVTTNYTQPVSSAQVSWWHLNKIITMSFPPISISQIFVPRKLLPWYHLNGHVYINHKYEYGAMEHLSPKHLMIQEMMRYVGKYFVLPLLPKSRGWLLLFTLHNAPIKITFQCFDKCLPSGLMLTAVSLVRSF